ncbi:hypothetical protein TNCV_4286991, partial [Trichonephila clavipes]
MPCGAPRWLMVEHLVMGIKTSPRITLGWARHLRLEAGKFIDQMVHASFESSESLRISPFASQ